MQTEADLILLDSVQLAFDRAAEVHGRGECEDHPALFADYESASSAAVKDAKKICGQCPLLDQCRELAEARRPQWGVWAGRAWKDGRLVGRTRPDPASQHKQLPAFKIIPLPD